MHIDTRVFGSSQGGRVSVHPPSAEDLAQNPHACAKIWAMSETEKKLLVPHLYNLPEPQTSLPAA